MISIIRRHFEKVLLGGAIAALLIGTGWTWRQERSPRTLRQKRVSPALSTAAYVPAKPAPDANKPDIWREAPAQSAGKGWVYELFTPPVIYYHGATHSFAVESADGPGLELESVSDLQLLGAHLSPYPVQLTGYLGSADDYMAVFSISGSSETVLARVGERIGQLDLTLRNFEVRKVSVDHGDSWPVYDVAGLAVLLEDRTGIEVVLDTRVRKLTSIPVAILQLPGRGKPREMRMGDTWIDGSVTHRIERIQVEPVEVVVARIVPGQPAPEIITMHPLATPGGRIAHQADDSRVIPPPGPGT